MRGKATNTQDVVRNSAKADAESDISKNQASMSSLYDVTTGQSTAYGNLKTNLAMNNAQLLEYIRSQTITEFNQQNMVATIPSRG